MMRSLARQAWCLLLFLPGFGFSQTHVLTVQTDEPTLKLFVDSTWGNFPHRNFTSVFHYSLGVERQGSRVAFETEQDTAEAFAHAGETIQLTIRYGEKGKAASDSLVCLFPCTELVKEATFDKEYRAKNKGKTMVIVPAAYELVNIVMALTPQAQRDRDLIYTKTPYFRQVIRHFGPLRNHRAVAQMDSLLREGQYFNAKMDGYAFEFDPKRGQLRRSPIYDHLSWQDANVLEPLEASLADFARRSEFVNGVQQTAFYTQHRAYYDSLKRLFTDKAQLPTMLGWLNREFPKQRYDCVKVIFSPLVGYNPSARMLEDSGFKEAQAHVNYPWPTAERSKLSPIARIVDDGDIVFTELNHCFLNPEADAYATQVDSILKDLHPWVDSAKAARAYQTPYLAFTEYMNWGLVTLYYSDQFSGPEFEAAAKRVATYMQEKRGFTRFEAFESFLRKLYRGRKPGQTVAGLMPVILEWFGGGKLAEKTVEAPKGDAGAQEGW